MMQLTTSRPPDAGAFAALNRLVNVKRLSYNPTISTTGEFNTISPHYKPGHLQTGNTIVTIMAEPTKHHFTPTIHEIRTPSTDCIPRLSTEELAEYTDIPPPRSSTPSPTRSLSPPPRSPTPAKQKYTSLLSLPPDDPVSSEPAGPISRTYDRDIDPEVRENTLRNSKLYALEDDEVSTTPRSSTSVKQSTTRSSTPMRTVAFVPVVVVHDADGGVSEEVINDGGRRSWWGKGLKEKDRELEKEVERSMPARLKMWRGMKRKFKKVKV